MTIGQAGKQAQHFGQHRQNQYQLDYGQADMLPLTPPRRRQVHNQEQPSSQRTRDESSTQQLTSDAMPITHVSESSTQYSDIQRSSTQENKSAQGQTMNIQNTVQRDEVGATSPPSSGSGNDLIQEVADQVFRLMLADIKKDRERNGGRFR